VIGRRRAGVVEQHPRYLLTGTILLMHVLRTERFEEESGALAALSGSATDVLGHMRRASGVPRPAQEFPGI
jgi:hypothetical protein